ncbi:MAG TPA: TraR/DksA C4-type zinc finger protein [Mycobacteriales bacterium]|nr:TraR/DksA C4-type zinc finger protein [Mycobacteriales bacterium]
MDQQDVRAQLEQMLRELDSATTTLEAENAGESQELSHFDQHPADTATELSDADRENAIIEAAGDQRVQVLAALQRLDDGSYGRCVDCGKQIPPARLEVRPEAARCVEDQAAFEAANG